MLHPHEPCRQTDAENEEGEGREELLGGQRLGGLLVHLLGVAGPREPEAAEALKVAWKKDGKIEKELDLVQKILICQQQQQQR